MNWSPEFPPEVALNPKRIVDVEAAEEQKKASLGVSNDGYFGSRFNPLSLPCTPFLHCSPLFQRQSQISVDLPFQVLVSPTTLG
jgi:hypothetical protein